MVHRPQKPPGPVKRVVHAVVAVALVAAAGVIGQFLVRESFADTGFSGEPGAVIVASCHEEMHRGAKESLYVTRSCAGTWSTRPGHQVTLEQARAMYSEGQQITARLIDSTARERTASKLVMQLGFTTAFLWLFLGSGLYLTTTLIRRVPWRGYRYAAYVWLGSATLCVCTIILYWAAIYLFGE